MKSSEDPLRRLSALCDHERRLSVRSCGRLKRWLSAALLCGLVACSPPKPDPATYALEELLYALKSSQTKLLWQGLSMESRAWLAAQVGLSLSPDELKGEASEALLERFTLQPTWRHDRSWGEHVRVGERVSEDEAWLLYQVDEQTWRVKGVKRRGEWRFDLFHATVR